MKVNRRDRISPTYRLASFALVGGLAFGFWPVPASAVTSDFDIRRDATVETIAKVLPSVVNIATATIVERAGDPSLEFFRRFFGWRVPTERREEPYSVGSGVIIDEAGYVLTNLHVLEHASRVQVKLWDGRVYDARPLVGTTQKDVALLQLIPKPGEKFNFKAIKFAKDDDLLLGETVLALGNPYGLGGSVTRGILSSKNRRPASGDEQLSVQDWLQTDADINPGNSGGPLVDLRGQLIGINVAVYREQLGMGVGFAIPVKQIAAALAEFFTPEQKDSLWFGARVSGFMPPLLVTSVQEGSPAYQAGLRAGQRIMQVDGQPPQGIVDFNRLLTSDTNHVATLQVEQDGEQRTVKTKLVPFDGLIRNKLGVVLRSLTPQIATAYGVNLGDALLIEKVEKNSPADKAQLQPGFLLLGIDDRKTGDLLNAADVLSSKKSGDRVKLVLLVPRPVTPNYTDYARGTVAVTLR